MLDILAAIFIDAIAAVSPTSKEDTRRSLAAARRRDQRERERHYAMAAQIEAAVDSTMAESFRILQGLDPVYQRGLNQHQQRYGLPTPIA